MQNTGHKFTYDGTFEGFLCLAVKCINMRSMPSKIKVDYMVMGTPEEQEYQYIRTNPELADKMYNYIGKCSCAEVQQMALDCFLTGLPNRERDMIVFITKAIRFGAPVAEDYTHDTVKRIQFAIRDLYREAQSSMNNINFERINKVDVSLLTPKNCIIPIIKRSVLRNEDLDDFIIYDKRHHLTFMRTGDKDSVMDVSKLPIPTGNLTPEVVYEYMWKYLIYEGDFGKESSYKSHKADSLSPMWYIAG